MIYTEKEDGVKIGTEACLLWLITILSAGPAAAENIYRWVDDNGLVHYGGEPPKNTEATVISADLGTGGLGATAAEEMSNDAGEEEISYAEKQRRERAEQRQKQAEANAERQRECESMTQRVAALEPSPRVILQDADGNPMRMDDDERLDLLEEARSFLSANCR